jgi:hypothetical protein
MTKDKLFMILSDDKVIKVWNKIDKKYVRFNKLNTFHVDSDSEEIRLKDSNGLEIHIFKVINKI